MKKNIKSINFSINKVAKKNSPFLATIEESSVPAIKSNKGNVPEIASLEVAPKKIDSRIINIISEEVAKKYKIASFDKKGRLVKVAMVNPGDINALNALRFFAEKEKIELEIYTVKPDIFDQIVANYGKASEIVDEAVKLLKENVVFEGEKKGNGKEERKNEILKEAPVTKLVQVIISHAISSNASDIHIEPMDGDYRVRFRVDGVLHLSLLIPKEVGPAVISRIKILANLKIDEKRKPQDGRFRTTSGKKEIDFRVSTLPVISGEKIVLRILDKSRGLSSIESLGLMGKALEDIKKSLKETYGMILFTGPTGSGKSTSLYALLKILNEEERNIITLEDPIEYNIEGLNQSQINPDIGYTFANGLRTILRQDPNVIMVGEIRDQETAELAVHAALTGHLMFSTLHTNTAIGAIPRLIDMKIEPFLLSSSLRIVVAQRLVRKICEKCKTEEKISQSIRTAILQEVENIPMEELKNYGISSLKGTKFYHGRGCDACNGTGLKGRVAIYEVIPINENIKNIMTEEDGNEDLLIKEKEAMGILTMRQDGILKVLKGLSTVEEIERVTEGTIELAEEND